MINSSLDRSGVAPRSTPGNFIPDDTLDTVPIPLPKVEIDISNGFETGSKIKESIAILSEAAEDKGIVFSDGTIQLGPSGGDHLVFEPNPREGDDDQTAVTILVIAPSKDTCLRFHADEQGSSLEFQVDKESLSHVIPPRRVVFSGSDGTELPNGVAQPTQFFTETYVDVVGNLLDKELIPPEVAVDVFRPIKDLEPVKEPSLSQRVKTSLGRAAEWLGFSGHREVA